MSEKKYSFVIRGLALKLISLLKILASFGMIMLLALLSSSTFAQQVQEVEMADEMRGSGKIYIVVVVLAIVFVGIIIYLANLDRKMSRLEKEIENKK